MIPEKRLNLNRFYDWLKGRDETFISQASYGRSGRHWLARIIREATGATTNGPEFWDVLDPFAIKYYHDHNGLIDRAKNVKSVLLIRDPRDSFLSELYHHVYLWDHAEGLKWDTEDAFINDMQPTENLLKGKIKKWLSLFERLIPHDTVVVQYERLNLFPDETVERICSFLELPQRRSGQSVVEKLDNALEKKEDHSYISKIYQSGTERYEEHCLKWVKDTKMNYLHDHIWDQLGTVMLQWGYTKTGHATNLLLK